MGNKLHLDNINKYLNSTFNLPFFLFINDKQYSTVINELTLIGLTCVKTSDFCNGDDKLPDVDALIDFISSSLKNDNKYFLLGLGEFLALIGVTEAIRILSQLKIINTGGSKIILILRGLFPVLKELQTDPRFDNRSYDVIDNAECALSLINTGSFRGLPVIIGFKLLLQELEKGRSNKVLIDTGINLDKSIFSVQKINNPYEGIKLLIPEFPLSYISGSDVQWSQLLGDLYKNNNLISDVFDKHGIINNLNFDIYIRLNSDDYRKWLYFIAFKIMINEISNSYLKYVLELTNNYEDFNKNILNVITDIKHTDNDFKLFYNERKNIITNFNESDIANFVIKNRKNYNESIYKLTDNTKTEKEEIIVWVSKNGIIPEIAEIYPALYAYTGKFIFNFNDISNVLTEYFEEYKTQKLINKINPDFLTKVERYSQSPRIYNQLPTRNGIIEHLDKEDAYLYWLDSLGVEYLSFISNIAQKHGLSIKISIARAELPTITSINRDFFDTWKNKKKKDSSLDEIKHKETGGYNFEDNEFPIHLVKELDVIKNVIDKAATELGLRKYNKFVIASDHGASRLAVLCKKEENYGTDTKGEHSGRCCKAFEPCDLPFAVEENGYLVLADYGRFKGSRAANVEVHGGATLEEVVVPVIELTLKDTCITVELVNKNILVDFRTGIEFELFINTKVENLSVIVNEKRYFATMIDINHYIIKIPDIKKVDQYKVDVYSNDDFIGELFIETQGKSGKINKDFDELF